MIVGVLVCGCGEEEITSPVAIESEPGLIDSNIIFEFYEAYSGDGNSAGTDGLIAEPRIAIRVWSEKRYDCAPYDIEIDWALEDQTLRIAFHGVERDIPCLSGPRGAGDRVVLDLDNGEYIVLFEMEDSYLKSYNLTVDDSAMRLSVEDTEVIYPTEYTYWRFPPQSFAAIFYSSTAKEQPASAFVDSLHSRLDVTEIYFPASGKTPWPRGDNENYAVPTKFFQYQDEHDYHRAGEVLQSFKDSWAREPGIWLWNWRNEHYRSWKMPRTEG